MTAQIIDGKALAAQMREDLKQEIATSGLTPGLAVVLVGDDPASQVYVKNKDKAANACGIAAKTIKVPSDASEAQVLNIVDELNKDNSIDGILVQLPLPEGMSEEMIINSINPAKDVDGFHIINSGLLATGQNGMVPCTPLGCKLMLKEKLGDLSGKHAVVIGRSNIVGKPMAALLLAENCTVTVAHSRTKDIEGLCKQADIIVAAVGRPNMVKASWVKQGACVIDVGINRGEDGKLVGDVDFNEVKDKAAFITPVPGGVGPMTIACLLLNTFKAAQLRRG